MERITADSPRFSHYYHLHQALWSNAKTSTAFQKQIYDVENVEALRSRIRASNTHPGLSKEHLQNFRLTTSKTTLNTFRLEADSKAFLQPTGKYLTKGILIREWFETAYARMLSLAGAEKQRCFVISGGTGVGKTHYLQYILLRRLLDGKATTIQFDPANIFWFRADGVFVVHSWSHPDLLSNLLTNTHLIHLLDVQLGPTDVVLQAVGVMVATSSPCDLASTYKWMDRQVPTGCILWTEPLTWEETYVVCKHFAPPFFKTEGLADIARVFLKYGPSVSVCLNLANSPSREVEYERNISIALNSLKETSHWLPLPDSEGGYPRYIPFLFGIYPPETPSKDRDDSTLNLTSQCFPLSPYIVERLFNLALKFNPYQGKTLLQALTRNSRTRDAAEHFFELAVQYRLRKGLQDQKSQHQNFILNPLPNSSDGLPTNFVGFDNGLPPKVYTYIPLPELPEVIQRYPGRLLTPFQTTWPSVKHLMVRYPNDSESEFGISSSLPPVKEPHVYVVYPTLQENPLVLPAFELEKIRKAIPEGFLGFKWDKWSLIVVQLEGQSGEGVNDSAVVSGDAGEKKLVEEWTKRLEQFTMTVSADQLFDVHIEQRSVRSGVKL
ncbi:hypothetical protein D9758_009596 [Tetrapyrgos nigripes]|uniref:Uncharacterized protein n=1 Tax=Tetrapyrgos nigripes TaxID=182062 RepID=A0A8H5GCV0_9AGAR|nr:hypothetical protein D9758_009596 [Tetrapyrgos nigripes]